jgi:hypothetical protein
VIRNGKTTDLLRTLDPKLDSIKGIWFMDGGLKWNRDDYARLQVPVTPPENYTLKLKVRRLFGDDQFGIGLIVGGRQTLLSVDAYGGQCTGLHLLDGKKSKDNESTHKRAVLPLEQTVDLEVRVRPNAVTLRADDRTIVDWSGNASRLSQDERYAVPRTDWLFLASWNTQCEVTEFLLIDE